MVHVYDPTGADRGVIPGASVDLEVALRLAWGLGPHDEFMVAADDTNVWSLSVYRPRKEPAIVPVGIRSTFVVTPGNRHATRAAMIEAAWLDLVDDGWVIEDPAISQNRQGSVTPGSIYRRT